MLLGINYKTANEHLRRLVNPGLVWKRRIVKNYFGLYYQSRQKDNFKSYLSFSNP